MKAIYDICSQIKRFLWFSATKFRKLLEPTKCSLCFSFQVTSHSSIFVYVTSWYAVLVFFTRFTKDLKISPNRKAICLQQRKRGKACVTLLVLSLFFYCCISIAKTRKVLWNIDLQQFVHYLFLTFVLKRNVDDFVVLTPPLHKSKIKSHNPNESQKV